MTKPTGKVFVVQRPAYYDRDRRGWVNKYDLTPAEEFGQLTYLLKPSNIFKDKLATAIENLKIALADYNPQEDHILAIGDPVAIAAAVMVASKCGTGPVSILKFDRLDKTYTNYFINAV